MKRSSWLLIFILAFLPVIFSYQACTWNQPLKFTGAPEKNSPTNGMGGNGEPYEDKPKSGLYVRYVPELTCDDKIPRPYQEIRVKSDLSVSLTTTDFKDCTMTEDPVASQEFNHSDFNSDYLGFKDGVFIHQQDPATAPVPAEAWCRVRNLQDEAVDIVVTAGPASVYNVTIRREHMNSDGSFTAMPPVIVAATRQIVDRQVTYQALNFNLTLNMAQLPIAPRKNLMVFSHLWDGSDCCNLAVNADHFPPIPTSQWFGPISYQHTYDIPANIAEGTYILENGLAEYAAGGWQSEMLDMGPGVTVARNPYHYDVGHITVSSTLPESSPSTPLSLLADGLGSLIRIFKVIPDGYVVRPGSSVVFTLNWLAPPAQMPSRVQYTLGGQSVDTQVDCRVGGVFDFRSAQKPLQ